MIKILFFLFLFSFSLQATTIKFTPFETGGISDLDDLNNVDITMAIEQGEGSIDFTITNRLLGSFDGFDPVVTKIAFGSFDETFSLEGISDIQVINSNPIVSFTRNDNVNIPGSSKILYELLYGFSADPPPTLNGINAGESLELKLYSEDIHIDDLLNSIRDGEFGAVIHVQSINGGSAAFMTDPYVSRKPEPNVVMLLSIAGFVLLFRRVKL